MDSYVIDTNVFFNLEVKTGLGDSAHDIIVRFTEIARKLQAEKKAQFFIPPSIAHEITEFTSTTATKQDIDMLLGVFTIKSPHVSDVQFPASVFYTLIDEIRVRSYRGLTIAQEQIEATAQLVSGKTFENKVAYQKGIGEIVSKLRERYRQATRFNFLDSTADLDLIVLAKEMDAHLVSVDEGVVRWGRLFGVKEVSASILLSKLTQ